MAKIDTVKSTGAHDQKAEATETGLETVSAGLSERPAAMRPEFGARPESPLHSASSRTLGVRGDPIVQSTAR